MTTLNRHITTARASRFDAIENGGVLDALIIGAGIGGAPIYQELCQRGYRVGLVDKSDFASGTSQASGMLIWGGLLYLKSLDISTVIQLCRARKNLLGRSSHEVSPLDMHFLIGNGSVLRKALLWTGMQLYWLLGGCDLMRPRFMNDRNGSRMIYQEAMLRGSDSRFVIERIAAHDSPDCIAINHCRVTSACRDQSGGIWRIDLKDEISQREHSIRAKVMVNAAGVWADEVNRLACLDSPFKHVLSKGVYLAFPRAASSEARVYPMHGRNDILTHVPWGPVSMWGPTETRVLDLNEGFSPDRDDIGFLLDQARLNPGVPHRAEDVVSIRCGIRPLAVPRNFNRAVYPLSLSRKHQLVTHRERMALTLYGGKFTSGTESALHVAGLLNSWIKPRRPPSNPQTGTAETRMHDYLGHAFVSPEWARDRESCVTLDDYLRRRTNIAQWTPRMGLGRNDEHRNSLLEIAAVFTDHDQAAKEMLHAYEHRVRSLYDPLLDL